MAKFSRLIVICSLMLALQSPTKVSLQETSQYHVKAVSYSYQTHVEWLCFNETLLKGATNCCEKLASSPIACLEDGPALKLGQCATYDNNLKLLSVAGCRLLHRYPNITDRGYLSLPKSLTELNEYMCSPLNRKGLVCSECIDGFGPSVTSFGNVCTKCTGTWYYRLILFLLIELVPITIFF